jgi:hypothetical protein
MGRQAADQGVPQLSDPPAIAAVSRTMRHPGRWHGWPSPHKLRGVARHIAVIASTNNVPEPTITPAKPNIRASLSAPCQYVPDWLLDRSRTLAHFVVGLPSSARRRSPDRPLVANVAAGSSR